MILANQNEKKIFESVGAAFYQLSQFSQSVYWIRTTDLREFIYVNDASIEIFGASPGELYNNVELWLDRIAANDKDRIRQLFMEVLAGKKFTNGFNFEYHITLASGKSQHLKEEGVPIFKNKECIAYAGMTTIISEKPKAYPHAELGHFANFFTKALESVFWVRDESGKKQVYVSSAITKIWGIEPQELYKNPELWINSIVEEDRHKFVLDEHYQQQESRYRILTRNNEIRWIKDINFPIRDSDGVLFGFAGIADDITEDVLREQELRLAKEKAENANQAKSDFLAMMSHELRTPLNAILGMTQILSASPLTSEQQDQLEVVTKSGQSLLCLLNDILDFAKLEVGKLTFSIEEFDLIATLNTVTTDMSKLAENKNLRFILKTDPKLPSHVTGDSKRLQQILINLIANAIKYTEEGSVTLMVEAKLITQTRAAFVFTVSDTGIGIPQTKLENIFDKFQQIDSVYKRKHEGVGLGLAIVKELVDKMSGTIKVTSVVGSGSTFICTLPMDFRSALHHAAESGLSYVKKNNNFQQFHAKVLVVEDNAINQKIAVALLEQLGCVVDVVDNGQCAIEKFQTGYDLIFLDIGLPDMDGFEVAKCIREIEDNNNHLPIIALTAHVFAQDKKRCFEVGMDEVMAKPVMRSDLIAVLNRWVVQHHE